METLFLCILLFMGAYILTYRPCTIELHKAPAFHLNTEICWTSATAYYLLLIGIVDHSFGLQMQ